MIIYKTTNIVNGKIYIGQDSKNNSNYFGSGKVLKQAILKYGKENFIKEILEECNSKEELDNKEKYWISFYNSVDKKIGYNICIGGQGGDITNRKGRSWEEIYENLNKEELIKKKNKSSLRMKNNNPMKSLESRQKISKKQKGKKMVDIHGVEKMKEISVNQSFMMKKNNPMKNIRHNEILRKQKISLSNKIARALLDTSGDKNPNAKSYEITSPLKEVFFINGGLINFLKKNNLIIDCFYNYVNKGEISKGKYKGWKFNNLINK